jgi:hypothetical protein
MMAMKLGHTNAGIQFQYPILSSAYIRRPFLGIVAGLPDGFVSNQKSQFG